jgi:DivIVA domain-containing protein
VSEGQRFRRRALRRGYKVDEVDTFLDRVEATLAGDPMGATINAQEVHDVVFRVRFGGYDEWQVDLHLDRVERQLAEHEERGGAAFARGAEGRASDMRMGPGPSQDRMGPPPQERVPLGMGHGPGMGPGQDRMGPGPGMGPGQGMGPGPGMGPGGPGPGMMGPGPDRMGPPDRMGGVPERLGPPERVGPPDRFAGPPDRMAPPERMAPPPMERPGPPSAPPPPMPQRPMQAPGGPPPGRDGYNRYDEPTYGGAFDEGGYEQPRPGGRPDMTAEIRMPDRGHPDRGMPERMPDRGMPEPTTYGGGGGDPYGPHTGQQQSPMSTEAARVDQLRRTFQLRRFGSGYDRAQVDQIFDGVLASLSGRAGPVSDAELDPSHLQLVPGGYFEADVEAALKEVRDILIRRR